MEFPTTHTVQEEGYRINLRDGTVVDYADDGTLRKRIFHPVNHYEITFAIGPMTGADVEGIRQFYTSYRNQEITWTDPFTGVTYDVVMTQPPEHVRMRGRWEFLQINMYGAAQ